MKLNPGQAGEYKRRHDRLWPELAELLQRTGVREYSIFLEAQTGMLFATLKIDDAEKLSHLPLHPVMQKWWDYMRDIMEVNPDHSPVSIPLEEVFYLE